MLQMMAMENSTNETEAVESQVAVMSFTRDWLKEHPKACKWTAPSPGERAVKKHGRRHDQNEHEHGSVDCISALNPPSANESGKKGGRGKKKSHSETETLSEATKKPFSDTRLSVARAVLRLAKQ